MGYTHYWRPQRSFTDGEWTSIKLGFGALWTKSGILLTGGSGDGTDPITINDEFISFNGVEDDAYETFFLEKYNNSDFEFCKTAQKPYDVVVTALLLYIDHVANGALEISSDGNMQGEDWQEGRELFESVR